MTGEYCNGGTTSRESRFKQLDFRFRESGAK